MLKGAVQFTSENDSENDFAEAARAELYSRMYKWAAEDFTSVADMKIFVDDLLRWARTVERRLTRLGLSISSHTHPVMEHYHYGTGPQIGGRSTLAPKNPDKLKWPTGELFKVIENTTGVTSNLKGNKITEERTPKIGDAEYGKVARQLVIPVLKKQDYNKVIIKNDSQG